VQLGTRAGWDPESKRVRWYSIMGRGAVMNEPIARKIYYSIGEVCDLTGLKPHVLRYWETQFEVLNPPKNRAGNRVYRANDIELILLVKHLLYEEKYTIEGANKRLLEMKNSGDLEEGRHEVLGPEFLAAMKADLEELRRVLTPEPPSAEGA
jgi:DNA-binding transcriptional MerR regulator